MIFISENPLYFFDDSRQMFPFGLRTIGKSTGGVNVILPLIKSTGHFVAQAKGGKDF
jgi:hypothetical protein